MTDATSTNGPRRVVPYGEYLASHTAAPKQDISELERRAKELEAAQSRYQDALRAFPPEYYEEVRMRSAFMPKLAPASAITETPDELTDHNYDGIQEYDNPTPGWWYAIFAATIVFGVLYIPVYHMLVPSLPERHTTAEARMLDLKFAELNELPMGEGKILQIMSQDAWLQSAESVFVKNCALCHANDGSGIIGPNLTDDKYKNIDSLMGIVDMIRNGSESGAMPPQGTTMNDNEIALAAAYAASLRGKNLPTGATVNPDYEGVPIPPWPTLEEIAAAVQASTR